MFHFYGIHSELLNIIVFIKLPGIFPKAISLFDLIKNKNELINMLCLLNSIDYFCAVYFDKIWQPNYFLHPSWKLFNQSDIITKHCQAQEEAKLNSAGNLSMSYRPQRQILFKIVQKIISLFAQLNP